MFPSWNKSWPLVPTTKAFYKVVHVWIKSAAQQRHTNKVRGGTFESSTWNTHMRTQFGISLWCSDTRIQKRKGTWYQWLDACPEQRAVDEVICHGIQAMMMTTRDDCFLDSSKSKVAFKKVPFVFYFQFRISCSCSVCQDIVWLSLFLLFSLCVPLSPFRFTAV